jgi:hypothetical protein
MAVQRLTTRDKLVKILRWRGCLMDTKQFTPRLVSTTDRSLPYPNTTRRSDISHQPLLMACIPAGKERRQ